MEERNEKRRFHGRGVGSGSMAALPFQGLNEVPLKVNKTKQKQQEQNRFWSDFVGTRNLPLD